MSCNDAGNPRDTIQLGRCDGLLYIAQVVKKKARILSRKKNYKEPAYVVQASVGAVSCPRVIHLPKCPLITMV
jgi:hypothetical protein